MSGLRKQKDYDWKDSNVANIKSKEDRDVSLHFEQLWRKLQIYRGTLCNVQVVKNKSICVLTYIFSYDYMPQIKNLLGTESKKLCQTSLGNQQTRKTLKH